jgi:hypothetical protein
MDILALQVLNPWASMPSSSVSFTIQTATLSSSARRAAFNRRAPMTTSYFVSSSGRTRIGSKTPCVLKLAASSASVLSSKRLRGLVVIRPARQWEYFDTHGCSRLLAYLA